MPSARSGTNSSFLSNTQNTFFHRHCIHKKAEEPQRISHRNYWFHLFHSLLLCRRRRRFPHCWTTRRDAEQGGGVFKRAVVVPATRNFFPCRCCRWGRQELAGWYFHNRNRGGNNNDGDDEDDDEKRGNWEASVHHCGPAPLPIVQRRQ